MVQVGDGGHVRFFEKIYDRELSRATMTDRKTQMKKTKLETGHWLVRRASPERREDQGKRDETLVQTTPFCFGAGRMFWRFRMFWGIRMFWGFRILWGFWRFCAEQKPFTTDYQDRLLE